MDERRNDRGVAGGEEGTGRIYAGGIPAQQRLHRAALLICALLFAAAASAQDISFDPEITQEQFQEFSTLVGQSIYGTPVEPATRRGLLAFDVGVAAIGIPIDENAAFWENAVDSDLLQNGYFVVPKLVVSKGLGFANLSASYAQVPDTDVEVVGGAIDVPLFGGGLAVPNISLRGAYAQVRGIEELDLRTYGAEVFISKSFAIVTPYAAAGLTRTQSEGRIPSTALTPARTLEDETDGERFTVGVRLSLLFPKIVIEATQAEERSYAAKISIGL